MSAKPLSVNGLGDEPASGSWWSRVSCGALGSFALFLVALVVVAPVAAHTGGVLGAPAATSPVPSAGEVANGGPCTIDSVYRGDFEHPGSYLVLSGVIGSPGTFHVELRSGTTVLAEVDSNGGMFGIELPPMPMDTMLELRARGTAGSGQEYLELASYLGRVGHLVDQTPLGRTVRVANVPALALSSESTARYAMVTLQAPEVPVTDECVLADRMAQIDIDDLRERTAVVQIIVEDGGFPTQLSSSRGSTTTLEMLLDPVLYQGEVERIEGESPGRIANVVKMLNEPFCDHFGSDALVAIEARYLGQQMNIISGQVFRRTGAGEGRHINSSGADTYEDSCAETLDIDFAGERASISYPTRLIDGVPTQVYAESRTSAARITPIQTGAQYTVIAYHATAVTTFPFNVGQLPDEHTAGESRQLVVHQDQLPDFEAASVPGTYLFNDVLANTYGTYLVSGSRSELLAGGNGSNLDTGETLTWAVTPEGYLRLSYADRSALVFPVREEAPGVLDVMTLLEFNDGRTYFSSHLLPRKSVSPSHWLAAGDVPGNYLQVDGRVSGDSTFRFGPVANDARDAPTWRYYHSGPLIGQTFLGDHYHWSFLSPGSVVYRYCRNAANQTVVLIDREPVLGECTTHYFRRQWELFTSVGDVLYLIEDMGWWYGRDPAAGQPPDSSDRRAYFYRWTAPP